MKTLIGYDSIFLRHRTGAHPERPERLVSVVQGLKEAGLWERLQQVTGRPAVDEWIETVHEKEYIERLDAACREGAPFIDTPDSAICPESWQAAREAVAITLAACDMIMNGEADNGMCIPRPPGHHAEADRSMGFCLFNNIAIACRYLQKKYGLKRVLILDWDVHHGNGTQHSFEREEGVYFCSLHQHPATLFPGTGWPQERGEGPGRGFTLNLPLAPGAGDEDMLEFFQQNFLPTAREYRPEFVLISAGFDGHRDDPIGSLNISENCYNEMTRTMVELAGQCCGGRLLSLLEGGYDLEALARCVVGHVKELMNHG